MAFLDRVQREYTTVTNRVVSNAVSKKKKEQLVGLRLWTTISRDHNLLLISTERKSTWSESKKVQERVSSLLFCHWHWHSKWIGMSQLLFIFSNVFIRSVPGWLLWQVRNTRLYIQAFWFWRIYQSFAINRHRTTRSHFPSSNNHQLLFHRRWRTQPSESHQNSIETTHL